MWQEQEPPRGKGYMFLRPSFRYFAFSFLSNGKSHYSLNFLGNFIIYLRNTVFLLRYYSSFSPVIGKVVSMDQVHQNMDLIHGPPLFTSSKTFIVHHTLTIHLIILTLNFTKKENCPELAKSNLSGAMP